MNAAATEHVPLKRFELCDLMKARLIAEYIGDGPVRRRFGKYPGNDPGHRGIPTAMASYLDGYATGYTWVDNYTPGGPNVCGVGRKTGDHDWVAFCKAEEENYQEFHRGFNDGRAKAAPTWPQLEHLCVLGYN